MTILIFNTLLIIYNINSIPSNITNYLSKDIAFIFFLFFSGYFIFTVSFKFSSSLIISNLFFVLIKGRTFAFSVILGFF